MARGKKSYRKKTRAKRRKRNVLRRPLARTGGLMGMEKKFVDQYLPVTTIGVDSANCLHVPSGTNYTAGLVATTQGSGAQERDGRIQHNLSIHLQGRIRHQSWVSSGDSAANFKQLEQHPIRMMLILDTQLNGAALAPGLPLVMQGTAIGPAGTQVALPAAVSAYGFRNLENTQRFKVLYDKIIVPRLQTPTVVGSVVGGTATDEHLGVTEYIIPFEIHKALGFKSTWSAGTAGTAGMLRDNALGLYVFKTGEHEGSDRICDISYISRLRFSG